MRHFSYGTFFVSCGLMATIHLVMADDDLDSTYLFRRILQQLDASIQLSVVHDGDGLLDFLYFNTVDLIFLDLNMPCKSGFVCLDAIRLDPRCKQVPIIVYSSSTRQSDIRRAYAGGASLYVVKPFSALHLKHALQHILSINWKAPVEKMYFINNSFVPVTDPV